jgi:recA bacterial DNA recombination protein
MYQKNNLRDFLQLAFGINIESLKEGEEVDTSKAEKKIMSFNHSLNVKEFNRVNKVIRKEDSTKYILNNKVECSKEHRFYIKVDIDKEGTYMEVKDISKLKNFYVFDGENYIKGVLKKTKETLKVYDLEVDKVHNFFTGGYLSHNSYGNPFIEVGGEAIKYYTAMKIELSKSLDKDADGAYGIDVKAKITKSKVGIPYGEAAYYVEFGKGIVRLKEIYDLALNFGIITKGGAWFTLPEVEDKIQGEEKVMEFLLDNPDYASELETRVLNKIKGEPKEVVYETSTDIKD